LAAAELNASCAANASGRGYVAKLTSPALRTTTLPSKTPGALGSAVAARSQATAGTRTVGVAPGDLPNFRTIEVA